ncbi:CLUMA_CG007371, isoform A [Clunio marinus]|uniref:CLUMA_CG007371, isoform A n=1 Tax=Clunio marinus TaxID=568069 RepID=A0A1J1I2M8_9DIPT|nr:CLUMA_CG007371, isoform A [Clunio marinus]
MLNLDNVFGYSRLFISKHWQSSMRQCVNNKKEKRRYSKFKKKEKPTAFFHRNMSEDGFN